MAGRPSQRLRGRAQNVELNILPVMNVMTILIPFLLLTATFVKLTIIDSTLPAATQARQVDTTETSPTPTPEEKKLNLTVFVTKDGFAIAGYGGVLNVTEEKAEEGQKPKTIIDKNPDGTYNFVKLKEILIRIKEAYPGQNTIILLPEAEVLYDDIVRIMDTARTYEKKNPDGTETEELLFPAPVLAARLL